MENANQAQYAPVGSHRARSVVVTTPTGNNPSIIKWLLLAFLVIAMLFMGLVTVLLIGLLNTGPIGLIVGMVTAILPVPLYLALVVWIDRYEPEPWWLLALTFGWGATGAVFFSFIINSIGGGVVSSLFGPAAGQIYGASVSAPIVEETFKAVALFCIFFFRRREFDGVMDGIVYAAMVGLGFAMTENFSYYGKFGPFLFLLRGTFLAFAHPLFTSMTGIGLGIAAESKNILVKIAMPIFGLMTAMGLHAFNNSVGTVLALALGDVGGLLGLGVLIISIPFFCLCVVGLAVFALYRESKKIRLYLQGDISAGSLTQQEVNIISSVFKRIGASFGALTGGGFKGWHTRGRFHHVATELAFFRSNIAKGLILQDANAIAQENEYAKALAELRAQLPAG